jgi:hypothetical protein
MNINKKDKDEDKKGDKKRGKQKQIEKGDDIDEQEMESQEDDKKNKGKRISLRKGVLTIEINHYRIEADIGGLVLLMSLLKSMITFGITFYHGSLLIKCPGKLPEIRGLRIIQLDNDEDFIEDLRIRNDIIVDWDIECFNKLVKLLHQSDFDKTYYTRFRETFSMTKSGNLLSNLNYIKSAQLFSIDYIKDIRRTIAQNILLPQFFLKDTNGMVSFDHNGQMVKTKKKEYNKLELTKLFNAAHLLFNNICKLKPKTYDNPYIKLNRDFNNIKVEEIDDEKIEITIKE